MVSSIFFNKKDSFRDFKLIIEKPPDFNFHKNIYNVYVVLYKLLNIYKEVLQWYMPLLL